MLEMKLILLLGLIGLAIAFPSPADPETPEEVEAIVEPAGQEPEPRNLAGLFPVDKENLAYNPNYGYFPGAFRKAPSPMKRQYIYNSYKGYVPVPIKDGKQVEVEGKKYDLHPFYGFVPAEETSGNKTAEIDVPKPANDTEGETEKMVYHHLFGFIMPKDLEEKIEKQSKIRYNYHPRYGYVAIPEKKVDEDDKDEDKKEEEEEFFLYHPYHGFVPESKAADQKMYKGIDMKRKFVYTSHLGYVPTEMANKKFKYDFDKGFIPETEEGQTEPATEEEKKVDEAKKYVYHPYFGFIPKEKLNDDNTLKGIDYDEKYIYHPYYGFVPESQLKSDEEKVDANTKEVREKRNAQVALPSYQFPIIPAVIYAQPNQAVAKEHFTVPASTNLIQNNVAFIPGIAAKQDPETPTVAEESNGIEASEGETILPVVPVGASVAQEALPEKDFPIFPYDPDQDAPAALAF